MVVLTPKVITDILTNPLKGDSYASRSNAEDFQMKVHESPLKRLVMVQDTADKRL